MTNMADEAAKGLLHGIYSVTSESKADFVFVAAGDEAAVVVAKEYGAASLCRLGVTMLPVGNIGSLAKSSDTIEVTPMWRPDDTSPKVTTGCPEKDPDGNYRNAAGKDTAPDDPQRLIWYGLCTYWTDDWNHVKSGGVPHCPHCKSLGFQTTAHDWEGGAARYEREGNPGYVDFLNSKREVCDGKKVRLDVAWIKHKADQQDTDDAPSET